MYKYFKNCKTKHRGLLVVVGSKVLNSCLSLDWPHCWEIMQFCAIYYNGDFKEFLENQRILAIKNKSVK